jgi:hypothetical protein
LVAGAYEKDEVSKHVSQDGGRRGQWNGRTFIVSTLIGHFVGTPWPFGRLYIDDGAITVRTTFREKTCLKSEITEISLEKYGPANQLVFADVTGKMSDVAVLMSMRVKGVVAELERRGYPVVDRRRTMFPLPQGIVPWRDPDSKAGSEPPER